MASTTVFKNMIRQVIRYNQEFYPIAAGFKFKVDGTNNVWYPNENSTSVIPCNIVGVEMDAAGNENPTTEPSTSALLRFSYAWHATNNSTRYYLPSVDSSDDQNTYEDEIDKLRIYVKYANNHSSLGIVAQQFIQIHEADIDGQVEYDDNDFISTITIDLRVTTAFDPVNLNVIRKLTTNLAEDAKIVKPKYVKFYTENESYDISADREFDSNEVNTSSYDQIGDADGFSDAFEVEFFADSLDTMESGTGTTHVPTKYKLYSEDDILLDSGAINESSDSSSVSWKSGDSIKFTYTNNALNKDS